MRARIERVEPSRYNESASGRCLNIEPDADRTRLTRRQDMADQDPTTRPSTTQTQPKRQRGNGRIFSREDSVNLWCAYYLRGREYRESTGTTDRKKAERFLERRLKEVGADQIGAKPFGGPQQDRLAINQLLDALKADYELRGKLTPQFGSHLARIRDYFGAVRATNCSTH